MASTSKPRTGAVKKAKPKKSALPTASVREFRKLFDEAKKATDDQGRVIAAAQWGVYAFYDYDGEPIYVGQTNEKLRVRLGRHLTNQRSDAVAMRILDVFEVAEVEMWPMWNLEGHPKSPAATKKLATDQLDAVEYSAYLRAIEGSKFRAILNEKIPPVSPPVELPPSYRFPLISDATREERGHPDIRIARRAETLARLAAVAHERGEVSPGLRRVMVIQAVRLAFKAAERFAYSEGDPAPDPAAINVEGLIGSVLYPREGEELAEKDED